jgi:hypothetical protein
MAYGDSARLLQQRENGNGKFSNGLALRGTFQPGVKGGCLYEENPV